MKVRAYAARQVTGGARFRTTPSIYLMRVMTDDDVVRYVAIYDALKVEALMRLYCPEAQKWRWSAMDHYGSPRGVLSWDEFLAVIESDRSQP